MMEYTEHGLKINLDELKRILEYAENRADHGNMERTIYIKGSERPRITQYSSYSGAPIDHTYLAK